MRKSITYESADNTITISRTDLIDIIRECVIEDTMTSWFRERCEKLSSYIEEIGDYGSVVKILKPESKMSIGRFFDIFSGIMLVSDAIYTTIHWRVEAKKVMICVPPSILNSVISKITGHPKKVVAVSTRKANDFIDSLTYAFDRNYDFYSLYPDPEVLKYRKNDVKATQEIFEKVEEETMRPKLRIKNVIFNNPATIVFWYDGTKTVVKCQPGDTFDPEKGLAMAICKKILGTNRSQSNFNDIFKKWMPKKEESTVAEDILDMLLTNKGLVVKELSSSINESLGILGE